jgi:hypothetical protein
MAEEILGWVDCKCLMTWHTSGLQGDAESSPGNAGGTERLIRRVLKCPKLYTRRNNNLAPTDGGGCCCCCCCCCCCYDGVMMALSQTNNIILIIPAGPSPCSAHEILYQCIMIQHTPSSTKLHKELVIGQ